MQQSAYELIGDKKLDELVNRFYDHVSSHSELAPIFPSDFTETKRKQRQFLTQFFGGPSLYTEEHGHPMLRARHMPFKINKKRADAWLSCMAQALVEVDIEEPLRAYMFERFTLTAKHMINSSDSSASGGIDHDN
ncbi:globin [Paenalkalicoccus suaedae]|uniref:Globin n=1 Tax=Paenalkalicoccus suaedae TaxID=2592382 RepID=A0A859FF08_9BACI|nr:protoglobin domain-containing protein [Paenalkalicoccus suaedae]QKS71759.1 globin [Paenalkalicoccus suaedae]